jgi:hypothetical protein
MSKIGFPKKVLGKTKICDYPLFRKVEQNHFFKKASKILFPFPSRRESGDFVKKGFSKSYLNINPQKDLKNIQVNLSSILLKRSSSYTKFPVGLYDLIGV